MITLAVGLALDLSTKAWSFATVASEPVVLDRHELVDYPELDPVPWHESQPAIPGVLNLRLVINRGAVFGIAANQQRFFIGFTFAAVIGALYVFGWMTTIGCIHAHWAMGLTLAGGLGNLYDRICFAAVRDFIHMFPGNYLPQGWTWPGGNPEMFPWVFNVADVMLLVGMLVLMRHLGRRRRMMRAAASPIPEGQTA